MLNEAFSYTGQKHRKVVRAAKDFTCSGKPRVQSQLLRVNQIISCTLLRA